MFRGTRGESALRIFCRGGTVDNSPPVHWRLRRMILGVLRKGTRTTHAEFPPWENEFAVRRFGEAGDRIGAYTEIVMPHTYVSDLVHCVFSTKLRRNLIKPEIQADLYSFLGGIARKNKCKALMVGGTENHVHILLSLTADMPLAKAMQVIKAHRPAG